MAVPSKNFTIIADSAIDADSPITADLMEDFRDNDIHLEEWLGLSYTAAQDHDHDGVNSAVVALSMFFTSGSEVQGGGGWTSFGTGSLGLEPQVLALQFIGSATGSGTYYGTGYSFGTGAQQFMAMQNSSWGVFDTVNICGIRTSAGIGGPTEYGRVTAWSSSGITITNQTGGWPAGVLNYHTHVWGI